MERKRRSAAAFLVSTCALLLCGVGPTLVQPALPALRRSHVASPVRVRARGGAEAPSWEELQQELRSSMVEEPRVIDSALNPEKPILNGLTLYRERHGWCPYSERVWLALEAKGLRYETVLIDNTGPGRKPRWWGGNTPQIRWEDGWCQTESLDIVRKLDEEYPDTPQLWPNEDVTELVDAFRNMFPKGTRPSSRAAFLFSGYGGTPVSKSEFEKTLTKTDELLGKYDGGPFFYGERLTAADVAWAPFLERYSEQLPCLHAGLDPRDPARWPRLAAWYEAMMNHVPAYSARVRGDSVSWRRVLSMAGYGNAGVAPILEDPDGSTVIENESPGDWEAYASTRPWVARSPHEEAAARLVRNRAGVVADAVGQCSMPEAEADSALRGLAAILCGLMEETDATPEIAVAAAYLDERMCVPRDLGVLPARAVRGLAARLRELCPT